MKKIILIFFILSLIGCEKKKYEQKRICLPKETENGRGMFACYIGESTYIAKRQNIVTYNQTTGYLYLESYTSSFEFRLFLYTKTFLKKECIHFRIQVKNGLKEIMKKYMV